MELLVLDKNFEEIGRIDDFSSLQWIRRYYEVGQMQLNCSSDYFSIFDAAEYLFRSDTKELAFVDNMESTISTQGNRELKISGKMIEELLNDRVIDTETTLTATEAEIAYELVRRYFTDSSCRKVQNMEINVLPCDLNQIITKQYKGESVGNANYESLKEKSYSQRLRFDYLNNRLIYEVWQGKDRRTEQNKNNWMIFSDNYETITEFSYQRDRSDNRNVCYVASEQMIVEVDQSIGSRRREVYLKSSTSPKREDGTNMSDEEYRELLKQEGIAELEGRKIAESFRGTADTNNLRYRIDYDLGDLCTCTVKEIGKTADKRITEIQEVIEDGNVTISPIFGEEGITITTLLKKVR